MLLGSLLGELKHKRVPLVEMEGGGWDLEGQCTWSLCELELTFLNIREVMCALHDSEDSSDDLSGNCLSRAQQAFDTAGSDCAKHMDECFAERWRESGWDDRMRPRAELLGLEYWGQAECDAEK